MVNSFLEFQSDVEADAGRTFLVLTMEGLTVEQFLDFQIEMISQNEIAGIVKLEVKQLDSNVKLCYHLNGLISLTNYLKRQRISKFEFTEILDNILSVLLGCKIYLLNDNSFILEENFIYINPKSKQISLIYLPLEMECNVTQQFRLFLVNLLINTATIDTEDNYVQLLLNQIKADQCSLAEFREQLITITGNGHQALWLSTELCEQPSEEVPGPVTETKAEDRGNSVKLPYGARPKIKMRKTVLTISAILSVFWAGVSTLPVEFRVPLTRPDKAAAIIFGLSLASLLAIMAILTLTQKNKAVRPEGLDTASDKSAQIENSLLPKNGSSSVVIEEKEPEGAIIFTEEKGSTETALLDDQSMETSLLSDCCFPCLKSVIGEETIVINKAKFTVGRQSEVSDHVIHNKNIGRLHAEISCWNNEYYITDMDSTNGTFVNGSRILSNKQYLLNNNDKVALANLEYLFVCP